MERIVVPVEEALAMTAQEKWDFLMEMYQLRRRSDLLESRSPSQVDEWAELGLRDLFFMTTVILGYSRLTLTGLHYEMCQFIEDGAEQTRQGREWHGLQEQPREHFKTTIAIARSEQRIAENPDKCQLITSATLRQAKSTSRAIKAHIEGNPIFQKLYPNVVPDSSQWTGEEWRVKRLRKGTPRREPTVMSLGVGSTPEGYHFDYMTHDDLATRKNTSSKTLHAPVIEFYQHCQPLLNEGGEELINGTRFKDYDLYGWLQSEENPRHIDILHGEVTEMRDEEDEEGNVRQVKYFIFPDEWNEERLKDKRTQMTVVNFYSQYYNDVMPDELVQFRPEFFTYFTEMPDDVCFFMGWDPTTGLGEDPAGHVMIGFDAVGNIYVAEAAEGIWREQEQIQRAHEWNMKYHPVATRVETVGQAKAILASVEAFLEELYQKDKTPPWTLEGQPATKQTKATRILTLLQPLYERRKIKHHVSLKGGALERELAHFGVAVVDALPDGLYYAVNSALENGYIGPGEQPGPEPVTPSEKLRAGVPLTDDERITVGPTVETLEAYSGRADADAYWRG